MIPDASGAVRDRAGVAPDASRVSPDRAGASLDGLRAAPSTFRVSPNGFRVIPDAFGMILDASGATPDRFRAAPSSSRVTPDASGMIPDGSGVAPGPSGASPNELGAAPNPSAVIPDASGVAPDGLGAARKTCGGMLTALSIPLRSLRLAPKERREPVDQLGRDPLLLAGALEEDEGGRGLAKVCPSQSSTAPTCSRKAAGPASIGNARAAAGRRARPPARARAGSRRRKERGPMASTPRGRSRDGAIAAGVGLYKRECLGSGREEAWRINWRRAAEASRAPLTPCDLAAYPTLLRRTSSQEPSEAFRLYGRISALLDCLPTSPCRSETLKLSPNPTLTATYPQAI
jgi:hypothetical protein